ncbi:hypothetical protein PHYPSEUDO_006411 [Phytophthora pseudosyringae]|uniref:Uncharacterized protein n=1 Tax=Phytophthora pseudosyringae TaxID=221518 RepID=A0A8T1VLY1_9STRA|nr:hypothetical protein PHYPSEUDO_006411 [Phytophthora pseudosyringae]
MSGAAPNGIICVSSTEATRNLDTGEHATIFAAPTTWKRREASEGLVAVLASFPKDIAPLRHCVSLTRCSTKRTNVRDLPATSISICFMYYFIGEEIDSRFLHCYFLLSSAMTLVMALAA